MAEQLRLLDDASPGSWEDDSMPVVIRESRRARHLILQAHPPCRLELVVPRGTRPREVEAFLAENRAWLESARTELRERYPEAQTRLPDRIALPAIGREWKVEYVYDDSVRPRRRVFDDRLQLTVPAMNHPANRSMLREWLLSVARNHLKPWLLREAAEMGVIPMKVQMRTQRTRWGSCSAKGNISLNAGILFLDSAVARYLLIHELAHLRHLDHSARYWRFVERFVPDYRVLDKRLSESWTQVPAWALMS